VNRTVISRRMALALPFAALAISAACSDGPVSSGTPPVPTPPAPPGALAAVSCQANVRGGTVSCAGGSVGGALGDRIIGGQNQLVRLASSNVLYDSVAQVFRADITVQNLLVQRLGTDGSAVQGVKVFFHGAATATSGKGTVIVSNADGEGLFTGSGQPYFEYTGSLGYGETSAPKRWEWSVPRSVGSFSFTLYVSAPVLPVVVFDRVDGGNRDIWRVGLDGSDLVRLTTSLGDDRDPTVSNGRVVFTSYRDGNAELYSIPLAGGMETRLTTTALNETDPALSPDGTRLAYTRAPAGGITRVYVADANAGTPVLATDAVSSTIEAGPNWVDASKLAFTTTAGGSADIFQLTPPGAPSLLAGGNKNEVEPSWSPDGRHVAFATNRDTDTELYLMEVAGGGLTRLTTRAGSDGHPSWLADGRIVYTCYAGSTGQLCWLDPSAPGTSHLIPTGTGTALRPTAVRF
jgi:WD40-like Beta Propeller Repeat